jgi:hypothetical protein
MGDRGGGQQSPAPATCSTCGAGWVAAALVTPSEESKTPLFASCTPENCVRQHGNLETCVSDSTAGGATANSSVRLYSQS